jgi:hypothetical protein
MNRLLGLIATLQTLASPPSTATNSAGAFSEYPPPASFNKSEAMSSRRRPSSGFGNFAISEP